METQINKKLILNQEIMDILTQAKSITIPRNREHLIDLAMGESREKIFKVSYEVDGQGAYEEATVTRCKNGLAVNYNDDYMRRRDPDCMLIADDKETDKVRYQEEYHTDFQPVREEAFAWLKNQDLIVMPFMAGDQDYGYPGLLVAPKNAGFFAGALADLQGFIAKDDIPDGFKPVSIVYLAPTFRHTHYQGKQVVVHNRLEDIHEVFSFNLYPGPSAKKGIYGVLINIGELENWVTLHASTVKVTTPYDNTVTIMHEGASGGGKSEMIEELHREVDGRLLLGTNTVTLEKRYLNMADTCDLNPITDDMAICHPDFQQENYKLVVKDAESAWFLRVNHITQYGTSPYHEKICIHPKEPLIFLNIQAQPDATCLIWEHELDSNGIPCPNPRVIMPRHLVPGVIDGPVEVDVRSFGVRAPVCTKDAPSYGIIGCLHILPPALGWLWRLAAPRGHDNPSIIDTEEMSSEGVGSYWPFATGKMTHQANLLLDQIISTPRTRFVLIPNQNIGAYNVGFAPQWVVREYLARWGSAKFKDEQLVSARCPILGYTLKKLKVDGKELPQGFLQTNLQSEVGNQAYDQGANILTGFFKKELKKYLTPDLSPLGREIIECCLNDGSIEDYVKLIPMQ